MSLLPHTNAIAAVTAGYNLYPGESVWAAVTNNGSPDWIQLGDSDVSPGSIWSECCQS